MKTRNPAVRAPLFASLAALIAAASFSLAACDKTVNSSKKTTTKTTDTPEGKKTTTETTEKTEKVEKK